MHLTCRSAEEWFEAVSSGIVINGLVGAHIDFVAM